MILLTYASINDLKYLKTGMSMILTAGLAMRCIRDLMNTMSGENECSLGEALKKMKKRIFAVLLAILATSIVAAIESYY